VSPRPSVFKHSHDRFYFTTSVTLAVGEVVAPVSDAVTVTVYPGLGTVAGVRAMEAVPVLLVSATEVAVIVTLLGRPAAIVGGV
jgi:hypothetical protein